MHDRQLSHAARSSRDDTETPATPGKATLAEQLPPDPRAALLAIVRRGGGSALPEPLRGQLERALGASLGDVRVHTSGEAAGAAAGLDARACAVGQDIVFGAGQYDPDRPALIAHEVAHTVQQRGASTDGDLAVSSPGDAHEHEADRFAGAFTSGGTAPVSVRPGSIARAVIARQALSENVPRTDGSESQRLHDLERRVDQLAELGQAKTRLERAYSNLSNRLTAACEPYHTAYVAYLQSLARQDVREHIADRIALDILFQGLGGLAGGWLQNLMRNNEVTAAAATAAGDLLKWLVRLTPGVVPDRDRRPVVPHEPEAVTRRARLGAPGSTGPIEPITWLHRAQVALGDELDDVAAVVEQLYAALRGGQLDPQQQSPLAIVEPFVTEANQTAVTPQSSEHYALELWRPWIEHWLDGVTDYTHVDRMWIQYGRMHREMAAQTGPIGRMMIDHSYRTTRERLYRPHDPFRPAQPPRERHAPLPSTVG